MRQLDLQLAFPRARPPREDVEDQLRAIDDLAIEPLVELAQLRRRQLVVEDDEVGVGFGRRVRQHFDFAAAEERGRVGPGAILQHAQHHARAGRFGEAAELFEGMFCVDPPRPAGHQANQRRPFHQARVAVYSSLNDFSTARSASDRTRI